MGSEMQVLTVFLWYGSFLSGKLDIFAPKMTVIFHKGIHTWWDMLNLVDLAWCCAGRLNGRWFALCKIGSVLSNSSFFFFFFK